MSAIIHSQSWLVQSMKILDYDSNELGVCIGYAGQAIQGIVIKEGNAVSDRTKLINSLYKVPNQEGLLLLKQIKNTQRVSVELIDPNQLILRSGNRKVQMNAPMLSKLAPSYITDLFVSSHAFLEGVECYFSPDKYRNIIGEKSKSLTQLDIELIAKITASKTLEQQGGLVALKKVCAPYDINQLTTYFNSIKQATAKVSLDTPIAIRFNSFDHSVAVSYDSTIDEFRLFDANKPDGVCCKTVNEIVDQVRDSFFCKNTKYNPILHSTFYSTGNSKSQQDKFITLLTNLSEWKQIHEVTSQNATLTDHAGRPWLFVAIKHGDLELTKKLIANGANINQQYFVLSPMYIAIKHGRFEIVKTLIQSGLTINESLLNIWLTSAAQGGHTDILEYLLQMHPTANKNKLLAEALIGGHVGLAKSLIAQQASLDAIENMPSVLFEISQNRSEDSLLFLVENNVNLLQYAKDVPLLHLAGKGFAKVASALIKKQFNVNELFAEQSPLIFAASQGKTDIVQILLSQGADTTIQYQGKTALFLACENGHYDTVKTLLDYSNNAEINSYCNSQTLLYLAAKQGHFKLVQLLIEKGASSTLTCFGETVLEVAQKNKHNELVTFLQIELNKNEMKSTSIQNISLSQSKQTIFSNSNATEETTKSDSTQLKNT